MISTAKTYYSGLSRPSIGLASMFLGEPRKKDDGFASINKTKVPRVGGAGAG